MEVTFTINPGLQAEVSKTYNEPGFSPKSLFYVLCKNLATLRLGNKKSGSFANKREKGACN